VRDSTFSCLPVSARVRDWLEVRSRNAKGCVSLRERVGDQGLTIAKMSLICSVHAAQPVEVGARHHVDAILARQDRWLLSVVDKDVGGNIDHLNVAEIKQAAHQTFSVRKGASRLSQGGQVLGAERPRKTRQQHSMFAVVQECEHLRLVAGRGRAVGGKALDGPCKTMPA
jgi:hypothetical protein